MSASGGTGWRWTVFWTASVLLYAVYAIRHGLELIAPVLPVVSAVVIAGASIWLVIRWRRRR